MPDNNYLLVANAVDFNGASVPGNEALTFKARIADGPGHNSPCPLTGYR